MTIPFEPFEPPLVERVLDYVFPPICVGCGRIGRWICETCWPRTTWRAETLCSTCGQCWGPDHMTHPGASGVTTALCFVADFDDIAREAVHALKYNGRHAISHLMGKLMSHAARDLGATAVVPLALHGRRRRERGYDQAVMLARVVARDLQLPYKCAIERTRYTSQQATLSKGERRENVRGAFRARCSMMGERVLLVDDVFTTGATMEDGAHALRAAGAAQVMGLVFARADQPG